MALIDDNIDENDKELMNRLADDGSLFEITDKRRLRAAILSSDTEKFLSFTRMMRVTMMMKRAKIIHKKMPG